MQQIYKFDIMAVGWMNDRDCPKTHNPTSVSYTVWMYSWILNSRSTMILKQWYSFALCGENIS